MQHLLEGRTLDVNCCGPERKPGALTRPKFKVISKATWAKKITRKYRVASATMVRRMVGTLSLIAPDPEMAAEETITKKASVSDPCTFLWG